MHIAQARAARQVLVHQLRAAPDPDQGFMKMNPWESSCSCTACHIVRDCGGLQQQGYRVESTPSSALLLGGDINSVAMPSMQTPPFVLNSGPSYQQG